MSNQYFMEIDDKYKILSENFAIDFSLHNNRISIDDIVYQFSRNELTKEEFLERYEFFRAFERRLFDCLKIGMNCWLHEKEDWLELEKHGNLCANDYTTFKLTEKYGMTPEEGEKRFNDFYNNGGLLDR
jgi:hypothetical protein